MSTDTIRIQICKIIQSGGFLDSLLSKLAGPLIKVAVWLKKIILNTLGITAVASSNEAGIQKKIPGSGTRTLIISNEERNNIWKSVQVLEDSNVLFKGITKTIEDEIKEQKGQCLGVLLGTLRANLLGNILTEKGILRAFMEIRKEKEYFQLGREIK